MLNFGVNSFNRGYGESINDIPLFDKQLKYRGIYGPIVFMLLGPSSDKKELALGGELDAFYKLKGEQIVRIVKYQTGKILEGKNTLIVNDKYRSDHTRVCESVAKGANLNSFLHLKNEFLRKNTEKRHKAYPKQLLIECEKHINKMTQAIIVMTHKNNYGKMSVAMGFSYSERNREPQKIIKQRELNENEHFYFPFNP